MLKINLLLKNIIRRSGMTQGEIARETGVSASRLSRIIHGYTKPRKEEEEALSRLLGIESAELFQ
ncbi:MAG: helix-turn-helix transcriptional regulator [Candidatus Schekmanbacteria bacterium]|nr:helix-turn-helix transcriptional regulator [Candidatus Schekmanbacteria bacterium]